MRYTALLADDSLTIQKVVKITLAHEDFDLIICQNEEQLAQKTQEIHPDIVFLDFSLSDNKSGYDLCKNILKQSPKSKVLMLYGTFDTVDESALRACNASDKIIKPFDSVKFVNLCKEILASSSGALSLVKESEEQSIEESVDEVESDEWTVDENSIVSNEEKISLDVGQAKDEMNDWSNKGVVLQANENELEMVGAIPPVIDTPADTAENEDLWSAENDAPAVAMVDDGAMPSEDDLAYPDMGSGPASASAPPATSTPSLQLQSMDDFATEIDDEDQPITLQEAIGTNSEEEVRKIEAEIADEINEDDLWSADESVKSVIESKPADLEFSMKEVKERLSTSLRPPENVLRIEEVEASPSSLNVSVDEIVEKVMAKLRHELDRKLSEMVEEIVEKNCQSKVETIAWEVIPDLAENLIKTEIRKISDSVIEE